MSQNEDKLVVIHGKTMDQRCANFINTATFGL